MFEAYIFPFEMVSILLLAAIALGLGSILMARRSPVGAARA